MQVGDLWADSGCVRGVGGEEGHTDNRNLLAQYGLKPIKVSCNEQFQFGDGHIEPSTTKYFYPTFVKGKFRGALDQAEVKKPCPQLMSKKTMKTWDVDLCFGSSTTRINKFGVELPFSERDVPIVNIFDFNAKDLQDEWHKIPAHFKTTEKPPSIQVDQKRRVVIHKKGKTMTVESGIGRPPRVVHVTEEFDIGE